MVRVLKAKYSVIPRKLLDKKFSFDIGPLINLSLILYLINFRAISKLSSMYLFDLDEILSKGLCCSYSTSIRFIFLNL